MNIHEPNKTGDRTRASACPICGAPASLGSDGAPCDRCCGEFRQRLTIGAETPGVLGTRMARESRMLLAFVLGLAAIMVAVTVLVSHYRGAVPTPVAVLMRATQIVLMVFGVATCLRADASARALPRAPRIGADLASGPAAAVEDFVPGAAPAVLALLLPWALRGNGHSLLLAGADLVLALATLTAATVIVYRSQLLARMRMTCQSESSDRAAIWARVSPTKRSLVVVLVWAVAVIGGCAMSDAFGAGRNALIDRAADAALAVGALLWFIAFRAARRECEHLHAWIGTRNT